MDESRYPAFLEWLEWRMTRPRSEWIDRGPLGDSVAEYVDPDGRTISIDERWFMEWVELGIRLIQDRLRGEWEMDEIDKRKKEETDGSQEQG